MQNKHYEAILLDLKLRDYCIEHGLNLHDVRTDAWFQWCEDQIEERIKEND